MVVSAERGQVTGAGQSALIPGDRVIQIAASGGTATAGGAATRVARVDQVLELAAGPVPVLGLGVVAGAADDGVERDVQAPQEVRGLRVGRARWFERSGWFAVAGRAGTWRAGTWRAGTWRAGTWRAGTWRAGTWRAGTWRGGAWRPLVRAGRRRSRGRRRCRRGTGRSGTSGCRGAVRRRLSGPRLTGRPGYRTRWPLQGPRSGRTLPRTCVRLRRHHRASRTGR